jgi:hypothetical protein
MIAAVPRHSIMKLEVETMPDDPEPLPERSAQEKDPMDLIGEFKRAPVRAGCLGVTLTGWAAVLAIVAVVALLVFLARSIAW